MNLYKHYARNPPKDPPPGFEATSDPRVFKRILKPCEYRGTKTRSVPCCGVLTSNWCHKLDLPISEKACAKCSPEWLERMSK